MRHPIRRPRRPPPPLAALSRWPPPAAAASTSRRRAAASAPARPAARCSSRSSGDAETNAVQPSRRRLGEESGNTVDVDRRAGPDRSSSPRASPAATRRTSSTSTPASSPTTPSAGKLLALRRPGRRPGRLLPEPAASVHLRRTSSYCAPKDFSTLALEINTDAWAAAGLTDADYPTTWDAAATVAKKLTTGGADRPGRRRHPRPGRRLHGRRPAAGSSTRTDEVTADSPENVEALTYVQDDARRPAALKFPGDSTPAGRREAFGKGKAAMTIEGNWLIGAMKQRLPGRQVHRRPAARGPRRPGHAVVHQLLGHRRQERRQDAAVELVDVPDRRRPADELAAAFGVMPSCSRASRRPVRRHDAVPGGEYPERGRPARRRRADFTPAGPGQRDPKAILSRASRTSTPPAAGGRSTTGRPRAEHPCSPPTTNLEQAIDVDRPLAPRPPRRGR